MKPIIKDTEKLKKKQMMKRDAIIQASIKIFSQKGFHNTKISEVAKAANVADGTVYLYFANKDDLLLKAFKEVFYKKLESVIEKTEMVEHGVEKLISFFNFHVDLFKENPYLMKFIATELRQSGDFYKHFPENWIFSEYFNYLKKLIDEAIAEGEWRSVNRDILACLILGSLDFVLTELNNKTVNFTLEEAKEGIIDIIRLGVRKK